MTTQRTPNTRRFKRIAAAAVLAAVLLTGCRGINQSRYPTLKRQVCAAAHQAIFAGQDRATVIDRYNAQAHYPKHTCLLYTSPSPRDS